MSDNKPVRVTVTYDGFRSNKKGECWLKVVAPLMQAPFLVPLDFWDETVQLYVFAKFEGQPPHEIGAFMYNGRTQTPSNEHRISLRSTMAVLQQTEPPFNFNDLTDKTFDIVLALPEQIQRAVTQVRESVGADA